MLLARTIGGTRRSLSIGSGFQISMRIQLLSLANQMVSYNSLPFIIRTTYMMRVKVLKHVKGERRVQKESETTGQTRSLLVFVPGSNINAT